MRYNHNRYGFGYRIDPSQQHFSICPNPFERSSDYNKKFDLSYVTDVNDMFKDCCFLTFVKVSETEKHNIMEFYNTQGTITTFKMLKKKKENKNATSE